MSTGDFASAINMIVEEKGIDRDIVMRTIEAALATAYKKDYGNKEQTVVVDLKSDKELLATVYVERLVVDEIEEGEEERQVLIEEAKKLDKNATVGEVVREDVTPLEYGRIAAQSAKQVIIQRLREAENEVVYEFYKDREDEILAAAIHRVEGDKVYVQLEKTIVILSVAEQIPGERYRNGQRLKVYLVKCEQTPGGPNILISRSHPRFIRRLLELEVPEIYEGKVEIKGIAREAGTRTKVSVYSEAEGVDPVGACVGQRGSRIQGIMDELSGEYVDVIEWTEDPYKYITRALSPAKIDEMYIDQERGHVLVFVQEEQRSLAIGRRGQNVRLAGQLTNMEVDIIDSSEKSEHLEQISRITGESLDELKKEAAAAAPAKVEEETPSEGSSETETTEEKVEETPAEEPKDEAVEEKVEEVVKEKTEEAPSEGSSEEKVETPTESSSETETTEKKTEEKVEAPAEEPRDEAVKEKAEEAPAEVVEEKAEEAPTEIVEEKVEAPAEEPKDEATEEKAEEVAEEKVEEKVEEAPAEEPKDEAAEKKTEDSPAEES